MSLAAEEEDGVRLNSCFACISKLLLSALRFIAATSSYSEDIKCGFRELGQAELLYG